jgi:hypothetical protein
MINHKGNTMPIKKNAQSVEINFTADIHSLKDAGYHQARAGDFTESVARYVMDCIPDFPNNFPDDKKAELIEGYRLRFNENNSPVEYAVIGGQYLNVLDLSEIPKGTERVKIGVDVAFSYTQQQFGRLKDDNPALHAVIKVWRDKCNGYTGNRVRELINQAKKILNRDKPKARSAVKGFNERVTETLDKLADNCKTAQSRGDESANLELYRKAKTAFLAVWNHDDIS